jgi:hypothetical protein
MRIRVGAPYGGELIGAVSEAPITGRAEARPGLCCDEGRARLGVEQVSTRVDREETATEALIQLDDSAPPLRDSDRAWAGEPVPSPISAHNNALDEKGASSTNAPAEKLDPVVGVGDAGLLLR